MRVENKKIKERALHALQWSICLFSLGEKYSLKTHTMANPFSCGVGSHADSQSIRDVHGYQYYFWDERSFSSFISS
jgi:hypothetical protein